MASKICVVNDKYGKYLKNMASKISILKDIYFENRFIYNKLEAILFEEMRRIGLLREIVKYTASFCFEYF